MSFEKNALDAIRSRAEIAGDMSMAVNDVICDLGGPVDFEDDLEGLQAKGLIRLDSRSCRLTLTERGRTIDPPEDHDPDDLWHAPLWPILVRLFSGTRPH
jgi:hypothetical protein